MEALQIAQKSNGNARVIGRPFQPGQVANPGGRPRHAGLADYLVNETDKGKKLGRLVMDVAFLEGEFKGARIPVNVRLEAATWIADRAFGKPVQSTEISAGSGAVMIAYMPSVSGELSAPETPEVLMNEAGYAVRETENELGEPNNGTS